MTTRSFSSWMSDAQSSLFLWHFGDCLGDFYRLCADGRTHAAWVAGLGLSAAIVMQQFGLAEILTAFSMALSTFWFVLIAYCLWVKADV